jgi:hypothetical protein
MTGVALPVESKSANCTKKHVLACISCKQRFGSIKKMREHRDEDHTCQICGQFFKDKTDLDDHFNTFCELCNFCFEDSERHVAEEHDSDGTDSW